MIKPLRTDPNIMAEVLYEEIQKVLPALNAWFESQEIDARDRSLVCMFYAAKDTATTVKLQTKTADRSKLRLGEGVQILQELFQTAAFSYLEKNKI